jgi:hypothetical protein
MHDNAPNIDLPVNFTVIKHPKEKISKSSIMAAQVISPNNVEILPTVEFPEFDENTILLFPDEEAVPLESMTQAELG